MGTAGFSKRFFASSVIGYFRKQFSNAQPQEEHRGVPAAVVACNSNGEAGRQRVWEPKVVLAGDVSLRGRGVGARTAQDTRTTSSPCRSSSAPEGFVAPGRGLSQGQISQWVCSGTGIAVVSGGAGAVVSTAKTRLL